MRFLLYRRCDVHETILMLLEPRGYSTGSPRDFVAMTGQVSLDPCQGVVARIEQVSLDSYQIHNL